MKITVEVDQLYQTIQGIRTTVEALRYNMDSLELLVNSLNGEWQGDAERAYASRIIYVRREFKEVEHFFTEYASLLERFAEEYTRCEEEITARARNL